MRRQHFSETYGDAVLKRTEFLGLELPGLQLYGAYRARAASGGLIDNDTLEQLSEALLAALAKPEVFHGVLLCTHGAMRSHNDPDADGRWITAVRKALPAHIPMVATFDTHGTPSPRTLAALDGLSTYRTVPHSDQIDAMQRALRLLQRRIHGEKRPHMAWAGLSLRLPSELASTEVGPLAGILTAVATRPPEILDAEVFIGQATAPAGIPTVGVVALSNQASSAQAYAEALSALLWAQRSDFAYPLPALSLAALRTRLNQIVGERLVIADTGDVPGAGAPGNRVDLLALLQETPQISSLLVGVTNRQWTELASQTDADQSLALPHPTGGPTLHAHLTRLLHVDPTLGQGAIIKVGCASVVVFEQRGDPPSLARLSAYGIAIDDHQVLVLKTGFIPEEYRCGREALMVLSPGVTEHQPGARTQAP